MSDLWAEIRKIPPVTRFLCGAFVGVTLPVLLELISPRSVVFVKDRVLKGLEIWRVPTSFFLGSSGLSAIFYLVLLYQTSISLETSDFMLRPADYAWQLILAAFGVLALNIPLKASVHARPFLIALVYLHAKRAPPGRHVSLMGLFTLPAAYLPHALVALDLLSAGRFAAAQGVAGMLVGHVWWWGLFRTSPLRALGTAPGWMWTLVSGGEGGGRKGVTSGGSAVRGRGGVYVASRRGVQEEPEVWSSSRPQWGQHHWGSGRRLDGRPVYGAERRS